MFMSLYAVQMQGKTLVEGFGYNISDALVSLAQWLMVNPQPEMFASLVLRQNDLNYLVLDLVCIPGFDPMLTVKKPMSVMDQSSRVFKLRMMAHEAETKGWHTESNRLHADAEMLMQETTCLGSPAAYREAVQILALGVSVLAKMPNKLMPRLEWMARAKVRQAAELANIEGEVMALHALMKLDAVDDVDSKIHTLASRFKGTMWRVTLMGMEVADLGRRLLGSTWSVAITPDC